MKPLQHNDAILTAAPITLDSTGLSARLQRNLDILKSAFRPRYGSERINARLIRDAGIDELECELSSCLNAPLIR